MPHTPGGTKALLDSTAVSPTLRGAAMSRMHAWVAVGVVGRFGDAMHWVREVVAGWFGLGCRRSGCFGDTFHLGWLLILGRNGDTMVVMHTDAARYRSGRSAIPSWFGPGCQRLGRFGNTKQAAQMGSATCGSKRSRCGVEGRCGVCGLQGRPGTGSPKAQHINGCARDTSRQCEEAGGGRQGSPRRERATGHHHLHRGCHAFDVLRERYDGRAEGQILRLDSEAGSACCGRHCGYWPHGRRHHHVLHRGHAGVPAQHR